MDLLDIVSMSPSDMMMGLFLPLILIFTITWGILSSIKMFNKKINMVLSVAFSGIVLFTPQFTFISTYLSQLGGQIAVFAFFGVFIFGTAVWALGRGKGIYYEQTGKSKTQLQKELKKKYDKYKMAQKAGDKSKIKVLKEDIDNLKMQIDLLD